MFYEVRVIIHANNKIKKSTEDMSTCQLRPPELLFKYLRIFIFIFIYLK